MSQIKNVDETSYGDPPSAPCRDIVFRQAVVGILPTTIRVLGFILAALGFSAFCALFAVMSGFGSFDWGLLTALILLAGFTAWVLSWIRDALVPTTGLDQSISTIRPLTLRLMPATLRVSGMAGRRPRRMVRAFPLEGISVEHRLFDHRIRFAQERSPYPPPNDQRSLIIKCGGEVIAFNAVLASESELDDAIRSVEAAMRDAHDLIGEGEAEVPEDLRKMVRSKPELL